MALYHGRPVHDPADIDLEDASRSFDWGDLAPMAPAPTETPTPTSPPSCSVTGGLTSVGCSPPRRSPRYGVSWGPAAPTSPGRALGTFAALKRPTAEDGPTNLPWHIDCGLGATPLTCPGFHFTVQLTASNPDRGAFKIVPGSHDSSVRRADVKAGRFPVATADTQPSDVTLHVTHELHAAPPPRGRTAGRRTLHLGFGPPGMDQHRLRYGHHCHVTTRTANMKLMPTLAPEAQVDALVTRE